MKPATEAIERLNKEKDGIEAIAYFYMHNGYLLSGCAGQGLEASGAINLLTWIKQIDGSTNKDIADMLRAYADDLEGME